MNEIKFKLWEDRLKTMHPARTIQEIYESAGSKAGRFQFLQYTGQKDRFGAEIYDGDICRIWDKDNFASNERHATDKYKLIEWKTDRPQFNFFNGKRLEVCANTYSNPEFRELVEIV